jgi:hypothetical protein
MLYWKPPGYWRLMFNWQFFLVPVIGTPGPMDATYESKIKVKLNSEC